MTGRSVFITGASGKIGNFLLKELIGLKYRIRVLCLPGDPELLYPEVERVTGNILDPDSYGSFLKGVDTVVHMAAVTHTNDAGLYFRVNTEGTRLLVKACEENGVKRFIYVSTRAISVLGGEYSVSKLRGEEHVKKSLMDWIILRPSEVYGISGREGVDMLIEKISSMPFIPVPGDGKYGVSPVHVTDLISALISSIEKEHLRGKIYTISGPESLEYNVFVEKLLGFKKISKVKVHIPMPLLAIGARAVVLATRGRGFAMDQIPRLFSEKSYDISEAASDLGYAPKSIEEYFSAQQSGAEFDKFGRDYSSILNRDVRFSGEGPEYFANYKAECVKELLGENFRGNILDYGCGVGLVSRFLREHFEKNKVGITGYDISSASVKEAANNVRGVRFLDDINDMAGNKFQAVIMANVLHHVSPEDRGSFLKKISDFLAKEGVVIIFEHNPYNPLTRLTVKFSVLDKNTSLLTLNDTEKLIHGAGLETYRKRYIVFFPGFLRILRRMEPSLGWLPAGAQYMCAGRSGGEK